MDAIQERHYAGKPYKVLNGTFYNVLTPDELVRLFERLRRDGTRVVLDYGDQANGRQWDGEWPSLNVGYIRRRLGPVKAPLLVSKMSSLGGDAFLDDSVVRIRASRGKHVIYQHPDWHVTPPEFDTWRDEVVTLLGEKPNCVDVNNPRPFRLASGPIGYAMFRTHYDPAVAAAELRKEMA